MSRTIALAAALVLAGAAAGCAHAAAPPAVRPALSGAWVLEHGGAPGDTGALATTGANAGLPGAERGERGERGGRGGERGDRPGGYSRGGSYNPEAVQVALAAVARGADRINIDDRGDIVHFRFADGSYFDLAPDGHSQDDVWRNIGRIRSKLEWTQAGALLLQRKLDEDVTVEQTFSRPAGSARLTVLTVVKGPVPRPVEQRRNYELAPRS